MEKVFPLEWFNNKARVEGLEKEIASAFTLGS
jgi:hypothetical protein